VASPTYRLFAFETELGWFALAAHRHMICRLTLAHRTAAEARRTLGLAAAADDRPGRAGRALVERIRAYAAGHPVDFRDVEVDTSYLTPLGQAVFGRCRRIPYGQTRTYGQLAAEAGRAGAARAVGRFMASNRTPILVPCHRVVGAGGRLGGFSGPGGISLKQRLLEMESGNF